MLAVVLLLLLLPNAPQQTSSGTAARTVTCAFSNPAYSGWCRVTESVPAGSTSRKTCSSVLACLNNIQCIKTYCNATTIRGGWRLETVRTNRKKT